MKPRIRCRILSAGGLIGTLALTPVAAIEPPPEEAIPPAALLGEAGKPQRAQPQQPREKSAFMGVVTEEIPEMLADHLGLSGNSGVIIRTVLPDSPAHKSGLAINDIITALDGKLVTDPGSFSSAIRSRKPGDRLNLDLIHKGKPSKVGVTLEDRPADATARMEEDDQAEGMPEIERLRGLLERNRGSFRPQAGGLVPDSLFEENFRQMRDRMNRAFGDIAPPGTGELPGFQQNSTMRLMDSEGSVEITSSNGDTQVKVRDKDNKTVWEGPWNTDEEKAAAPADIRRRIDKIRASDVKGFSFRFGQPGGEAGTIDN